MCECIFIIHEEKKTMNTHCSVSSSQRLMFLSTREQVSYQIHNDLLLLAQPGKPDLNHLAGRRPRDAMDPVRAFQSAMFHSLFFFFFSSPQFYMCKQPRRMSGDGRARKLDNNGGDVVQQQLFVFVGAADNDDGDLPSFSIHVLTLPATSR